MHWQLSTLKSTTPVSVMIGTGEGIFIQSIYSWPPALTILTGITLAKFTKEATWRGIWWSILLTYHVPWPAGRLHVRGKYLYNRGDGNKRFLLARMYTGLDPFILPGSPHLSPRNPHLGWSGGACWWPTRPPGHRGGFMSLLYTWMWWLVAYMCSCRLSLKKITPPLTRVQLRGWLLSLPDIHSHKGIRSQARSQRGTGQGLPFRPTIRDNGQL